MQGLGLGAEVPLAATLISEFAPARRRGRTVLIVVRRHGLREDSGGAGQHRGGLGIEMITELRCDARFSCGIERTRFAPKCLFGGRPAAPNEVSYTVDGAPVAPGSGKVDDVELSADDVITIRTGGGGGYGDPQQRPVEDVIADVEAGYVSQGSARDLYQVVLDEQGRLDAAATARCRSVRQPPVVRGLRTRESSCPRLPAPDRTPGPRRLTCPR